MTPTFRKDQELEKTQRLRGWIIFLLYNSRSRCLEVDSLRRLLDHYNLPLSRRKAAEEIDYLRLLRLVKVSLTNSKSEPDEIQQSRLIQRYADPDRDDATSDILCVALTAAGINFQEGTPQTLDGIGRIE